MDKIVQFEEIGLPVGPDTGGIISTQYNAPSETLVVAVGPKPYSGSRQRILLRQIREDQYREITLSEATRYFTQIVVCAAAPIAFGREVDAQDGNYCAISAIHLPDGKLSYVPAPSDAAENLGRKVGFTRVLNASHDAAYIYVAVIYNVGSLSKPGARIEHKLAKVSTKTGAVDVIATLPTPSG
jgi:hypothetical protein